jgi:hypothetical protein
MTAKMGGGEKAFLEHEEVIDLLHQEIARAGGQGRWAKMIGVDRSQLSKMLHGPRRLIKRVIGALKLRVVFAPEPETGSRARDDASEGRRKKRVAIKAARSAKSARKRA